MELFEAFLKVDIKLSGEILTFIKSNCQIAIFKLLSNTSGKINLKKLKDNLNNFIFNDTDNRCAACGLCDRDIFEKKMSELKSAKKIIDSNYSNKNKKLSEINNLINSISSLSAEVQENGIGKYEIVYKAQDLYSVIILNLINHSLEKIDDYNSLEYFKQIARVLVSTNEFVKRIEYIRSCFFKKNDNPFNDWDYVLEENVSIESINYCILDLMKKYNLLLRWRNWIYSLLCFDNSNIEKTYEYLPNVLPGILRKIEKFNGQIREDHDLILYGNETEEEINYINKKYGKKFSFKPSNKRKKLIYNFEKYLRWYVLSQSGLNAYQIFKKELYEHFDDWNEKAYKETLDGTAREPLSEEKQEGIEEQATNSINKGINDLKARIKMPK